MSGAEAPVLAPPPDSLPSGSLRRRCLHAFQAALAVSGAAGLYVRARGVRGATILMYHSVAAEAEARWIDPRDHLDPATFERQIRFLAARRRVVPLGELVDALEQGREMPAGSVVVTFDDGYLDNLTVAAPILERHRVPALLYVATGGIVAGEPQWVDRLYGLFRARTSDRLTLPAGPARDFDLKDPARERDAYQAACLLLLEASASDRGAWIDEMDRQLRPSARPPRLTLTWEDLRTLVRRHPLLELGGHTRSHLDLRTHGGDRAEAEIRACAEDLEGAVGVRPRHFSYPYGRWTPDLRERVRGCGFRSAVGEGEGFLIRRGSDPFALPRIETRMSLARLRFVTSGAFPSLSRALVGRA